MKTLIDKLYATQNLEKDELLYLLQHFDTDTSEYLFEKSRQVALKHFGNSIYTRGLIEFTNYCKNNCYYL